MADHVTEWLGAYHDGELHGIRLRQVERHLAECAACQAELDEFRDLSNLLQSPEPQDAFQPTERFVANLALRLPRQAGHPHTPSAFNIAWWLVPFGLLGIWLFVDITRSLSSITTLVVDTGLLNGDLAWLQGAPRQMQWFATAMGLFSEQLGETGGTYLSWLNDANLFLVGLGEIIIPQIILALCYLGWLLAWWLRHLGRPFPHISS